MFKPNKMQFMSDQHCAFKKDTYTLVTPDKLTGMISLLHYIALDTNDDVLMI